MKLHVAMSLRMQLSRIVIMMITEYPVPSLARNYPCKEYQIMYEHIYLCTCRRTNTHARVHLYEMSIYKSCWSWSVSQFSTLGNSQLWQFVQILIDCKFHSRLRVLDTDDVKQKTSLFSVQGKSSWYCFKAVVLLFYVICVRYTN